MTEKPFREAAHELAVAQGFTTNMGNVNWSLVAHKLPTIHYETLRKILSGERHLDMPAIEEIAGVLGVPADHFVEYRLLQAQRLFDVRAVGYDEATKNLRAYLEAGVKERQRGKGAARRLPGSPLLTAAVVA